MVSDLPEDMQDFFEAGRGVHPQADGHGFKLLQDVQIWRRKHRVEPDTDLFVRHFLELQVLYCLWNCGKRRRGQHVRDGHGSGDVSVDNWLRLLLLLLLLVVMRHVV